MTNYSCHTCQEPMKLSVHFAAYIRLHGPQNQKCMICGAVHRIDKDENIVLTVPGALIAKLSAWYDYPEYSPYRPGNYRVKYPNGNIAKQYVTWDGECWRNGPVLFAVGSIRAWQGLGGDMEHNKRMPYDHDDPLPGTLPKWGDESCD